MDGLAIPSKWTRRAGYFQLLMNEKKTFSNTVKIKRLVCSIESSVHVNLKSIPINALPKWLRYTCCPLWGTSVGNQSENRLASNSMKSILTRTRDGRRRDASAIRNPIRRPASLNKNIPFLSSPRDDVPWIKATERKKSSLLMSLLHTLSFDFRCSLLTFYPYSFLEKKT